MSAIIGNSLPINYYFVPKSVDFLCVPCWTFGRLVLDGLLPIKMHTSERYTVIGSEHWLIDEPSSSFNKNWLRDLQRRRCDCVACRANASVFHCHGSSTLSINAFTAAKYSYAMLCIWRHCLRAHCALSIFIDNGAELGDTEPARAGGSHQKAAIVFSVTHTATMYRLKLSNSCNKMR